MGKTRSPYSARLLTQADSRQMLEILQLSPIESGGLSICFDREPDIFIMANLKYEPAKYVGIFQGERLLGFGLIGYHIGMVSGLPQQVFHFSNVFMCREFRGKGLFFKAQNLFFQDIYQNACPGYAVIMKGNKNAERYVGWKSEKYPFVPHSSLLNTYDVRNIIITFKKRESKLVVRKARMEDIHHIVSLLKAEFSERLFAPHIDEDIFKNNLKQRPNFSISNYYVVEQNNQIIGTCAAWDCSSFKQIRILKYSKQFKRIKNTYNLFFRFFRVPPLPDAGQAFKAVYITDYAVEKRDSEIMNAMLRKIYNEYRSQHFNLIVFGSYKNDKLLEATKGFFSQSVESNIYLFHRDEAMIEKLKQTKDIPYIDVAFL
jgi:hypothetical protein